jgi:excisionase family DNA binding protein
MLKVKDVARELKLSIGAVYKAIQSGKLAHHRFGTSIRITDEQLTEFIKGSRIDTEVEHELPSPGQFKHL